MPLNRRGVAAVLGVMLALAWFQAPKAARGEALLDPRAVAIVERFASLWRATRGLTYRDVKRELLRDGKLTHEEVRIKLLPPDRAYLYTLRPVEGREILYDRRKNPRQILVHPGHFPDITLSIDIEGSLALRGQHHTMAEVGFAETLRALLFDLTRIRRDPHGERLSWLGKKRFDGHPVDVVALAAGDRPPRREAAKAGESLLAFARRFEMDVYPIFVKNPGLDSLAAKLEANQTYVVPAYRASRAEYWFDSDTGMLLKQLTWNEQGKLYESYEHFDMQLNPQLGDLDFDPDNPAYGF